MRTLILIGLLLLVLDYALMVMAHDADERAEEMYRRWKEQYDDTRRTES